MTEITTPPEDETENEVFPVEPHYHPLHTLPRKIYDSLASARLAMFLLVTILASCLLGTTILRGEQAWNVIFSSLWFNALLVLLVVNVACCFFGRIWGRRLTLISVGMILFHLSFVTMFLGIVYNSLFFFRGTIRLTEGETLPSGDLKSYDSSNKGYFYNLSKLKGETSLIKMHNGFKVDGQEKRRAYQISVGEGLSKDEDIIYLTHNLEHKGYRYFPDREGYSVLTILYDKSGKELYGAFLPLQSLRQGNTSIMYTTGSKAGPGVIAFPQNPEKPTIFLNVGFNPDHKKELTGEAFFQIWPFFHEGIKEGQKPLAAGSSPVADKVTVGDYQLSVKEVRYWVAMNVRYEPGLPIILSSLWVGLFGITLTTVARMFRKKPSASFAA